VFSVVLTFRIDSKMRINRIKLLLFGMVRKMKSEKLETSGKQAEKALQAQKQAEAALRKSEERFQLVAAEPKRGSLIPQGKSKTTPYNSQQVG
jgi:Tfp pilus assembly protein PilX